MRLMAAGVLRPRGRVGGLDLVLNQVPAILSLVRGVVLLVLADEPLVGELLALVAVDLVGVVAGVVVDSDIDALVAATLSDSDVSVAFWSSLGAHRGSRDTRWGCRAGGSGAGGLGGPAADGAA